jgi:hypothetical protein
LKFNGPLSLPIRKTFTRRRPLKGVEGQSPWEINAIQVKRIEWARLHKPFLWIDGVMEQWVGTRNSIALPGVAPLWTPASTSTSTSLPQMEYSSSKARLFPGHFVKFSYYFNLEDGLWG